MNALLLVLAWKVAGTLAPGRPPGSYVLSSNAAPGRYSEGSMVTVEPVALPYTLRAMWRRLGPEGGRSMHVFVAGGVVLIRTGAIAFYPYDEAAFASAGWTPLPSYSAHEEHAISVHQDRREVVVSIDGAVVARFALAVERASANVGFGMKSAPGLRSSIYLRDVSVVGQ